MTADLYSVQVSDYPADSRAFVNPIYRSVSAGAFPPVRAGHLNRPVHAMRRRVVPPRFLGTPPGKISHRRPDKIKVSHFRHMTADLYSVQVFEYPADRGPSLTLFTDRCQRVPSHPYAPAT